MLSLLLRQEFDNGSESLLDLHTSICNVSGTCTDAPGMTSDDIHVELHEGTLKVSGEKSKHQEEGKPGQRVWRQERSFQKFSRCFSLPENTNPEAISAKLEHGVLTVEVCNLDAEKQS